MPDKMQRFTQRARRVLSLAQEAAERMQHSYIGTEHLLLGLMREEGGVAGRVLRELGLEMERVEMLVERNTRSGQRTPFAKLDLSPGTQRVLELAVEEARRMGHHYIGTEHLLLALVRHNEGVAIDILNEMGVTPEEIRKQTRRALQDSPSSVSQPPAPKPRTTTTRRERTRSTSQKTPLVDQLATDLTQLAEEGKLDPIIGREKEIERVIQILSRRTKNNPALIGEPGVGKTAVAEGLAQRIQEGIVPELLKDKKIVTLDMPGMLAGAKYRGEFEERLKNVMSEIKKNKDIILFIDEMHTIIGAGAAEGAIDASNILKPALARGEIQAIGATTIDEYRKHVEKDPALERRFQPVNVGEPSKEETVQILFGLRDRYEAHHKVRITDGALRAAVELSDRYITDRYLPDKAIDLIDEAASRVRLQAFTAPPDLKEMESRLEDLHKEKEEAVMNQNYEKAAQIRDEEQKLKNQLEEMKSNWAKKSTVNTETVKEEEIAHIVASWTGIPVKKLK